MSASHPENPSRINEPPSRWQQLARYAGEFEAFKERSRVVLVMLISDDLPKLDEAIAPAIHREVEGLKLLWEVPWVQLCRFRENRSMARFRLYGKGRLSPDLMALFQEAGRRSRGLGGPAARDSFDLTADDVCNWLATVVKVATNHMGTLSARFPEDADAFFRLDGFYYALPDFLDMSSEAAAWLGEQGTFLDAREEPADRSEVSPKQKRTTQEIERLFRTMLAAVRLGKFETKDAALKAHGLSRQNIQSVFGRTEQFENAWAECESRRKS